MLFSIILSNLFFSYWHDKGWMLTSVMGKILEQLCTLSIGNDRAFMNSTTFLFAFLFIIRGITRNSEQTLILQSAFRMKNSLRNYCLKQCFRCSFSILRRLNALKYWSSAYPNLFSLTYDFDVRQITSAWCCNLNGQQCCKKVSSSKKL